MQTNLLTTEINLPPLQSIDLDSPRGWRDACRYLYFFNTNVLSTAWDDKFQNFGLLQKHLCNFLQTHQSSKKLVEVFRGSFKTTVLLGFCIWVFTWSIADGRPVSVCYNTSSKDNAGIFMEDFRETIRNCDLLHRLFPELPRDPSQYLRWTSKMVEHRQTKFHVASLETRQVMRHYCVLPGIFVRTSNGLEKIEKIKKSQRVLGMNGKHNEVVAASSRLHKGLVVEIFLWGQPETVKTTLEHRLLIWGEMGLEWREAQNIKKGDLLAEPLPSGLTRAYSRTNKAINHLLASPKFWRFIGYWLAEGCASERNRVRLSFGKSEIEFADEVKRTIESLTSKAVTIKETKSSTLIVDFFDKDVKEILNKFGTHSYNKHLPAFVLSANPNRQRELLIGYFKGDGCFNGRCWSACSVSRSLLDGIQVLLAKSGIESSIQKGSAPRLSDIVGNLCKTRQSWSLRSASPLLNLLMGNSASFQIKPSRMKIIPGFALRQVRKKSSIFYDGPVYDIQVKRTESFCLLGGLAHNCIIINDDLVNDENAFSEVERRNVLRKWKLQKSILTKYRKFKIGSEIDVGTPYHHKDLMAHIMKNVNTYEKFIVAYALPDESGNLNLDKKIGVLTMPEMYVWEDFQDKRSEMGPSLFGTQYELKIVDDQDKLCDEAWIRRWVVLPKSCQRVMVVDPAGTEEKDMPQTGIVVCDIDPGGYIYVVYAEEHAVTPYKLIKLMEEIKRQYDPDEIYMEKEKYSVTIADTLEHLQSKLNFAFVEHKHREKGERIFRIKQYMETGRILLGHGMITLEDRLINYPDCPKDLLDALAYVLQVMNPPKRGLERERGMDIGKLDDFDDEIRKAVGIPRGREADYYDSVF